MSDAAHGVERPPSAHDRFGRALAECRDEAIVDFGTTLSGIPLRWYRFTTDQNLFSLSSSRISTMTFRTEIVVKPFVVSIAHGDSEMSSAG